MCVEPYTACLDSVILAELCSLSRYQQSITVIINMLQQSVSRSCAPDRACYAVLVVLSFIEAFIHSSINRLFLPSFLPSFIHTFVPSVHSLSAGTHAEGGIWATLFGLLMWDVIFMDVPDVFHTAFQTAPLDLGTVVFYPTRKDAIEARLGEVRAGHGPALLQNCWQQHVGEWCRGVNWDRHGKSSVIGTNHNCSLALKDRYFSTRT